MAAKNLQVDIRQVSHGVRVIDINGEITASSDDQITDAQGKAGGAEPVGPPVTNRT